MCELSEGAASVVTGTGVQTVACDDDGTELSGGELAHWGIDTAAVGLSVFVRDDSLDGCVMDYLNSSPDIRMMPVSEHARADVVLVLASVVTDRLLAEMAAITGGAVHPGRGMVLVSGPLRERQLGRVFGCGVVSILPRAEATPQLITRAVIASGSGRAVLPETVTRWLVDEARMFQNNMLAVHGVNAGGLTVREVEVLKLLAEGLDTADIAGRLCYSERTIKKIIQDMMTRLGLHNRAHAVSYAFRVGVI